MTKNQMLRSGVWLVILGTSVFSLALGVCAGNEEVLRPQTHVATHLQTGLEFQMELLSDPVDGGAYAVLVRARNPSTKEVTIRVNEDLSYSMRLMIYSAGEELSKPWNFPLSHGGPPYQQISIPAKSDHVWFLPITDYLRDKALPAEELEPCRVYVSISLFPGSVLLSDRNVRLTAAALEGDAGKKYEGHKTDAQ